MSQNSVHMAKLILFRNQFSGSGVINSAVPVVSSLVPLFGSHTYSQMKVESPPSPPPRTKCLVMLLHVCEELDTHLPLSEPAQPSLRIALFVSQDSLEWAHHQTEMSTSDNDHLQLPSLTREKQEIMNRIF